MPDIKGTTRAQTIFLRSFRTLTEGPPPELWPSPAILRKWLRKPAFRRALESVQETLHFQADFHLANAATQAAQKLSPGSLTHLDLNRLLRLSHIRQRFTTQPPPKTSAETEETDSQDEDDDFNDDPRYQNHLAVLSIKDQAIEMGFLPPITYHPDFPPPIPQDTYYYNMIHHPSVLLWYMKLYTQDHPQDDRFQRILELCDVIVPHEWPAGPFPHFPNPEAATGDNQ